MRGIPQRIAPLSWRRPTFVWTPLALAIALGWPLALFADDGPLGPYALVAGAAAFAAALISMGMAWVTKRAPKTRRDVAEHVVFAGAGAALFAPFVLAYVLKLVAEYEESGSSAAFDLAMSAAIAPLSFMLGLPVALASGLVFALIALKRPEHEPESAGGSFEPFP